MSGKELCGMSKQEFITRSPQYMGDILWAHLEILQRESEQSSASAAPASVLDIKAPLAPASLPHFYLPQHPLPPATVPSSKTYTDLEPPVSKMSGLPPALVPPP